MRIAIVKRRYSLRAGGSERYCVNLARNLTGRGHEVTVIGERIDEDLRGEVPFLPVAVNRATSWTRNRSFAVNARRVAARGNFEIVYGLGRALGLDAVRVTERLQSHWVNVRYRPAAYRFLQRWNPRHRTLIDLERSIYQSREVRRIITQSQLDSQLVQKYYGIAASKIRIVYNGVDTESFHPGVAADRSAVRRELRIADDTPLAVFASMDFDGKGLAWILQALHNAAEIPIHLAVLGTGPISRFRRLAAALGLEQRVHFAGRVSGIQRYYGAGDLFLLPTHYEPFPNVNLEAMACGLPVLTTQTAGGVDIIREGENGYSISSMHDVAAMTAVLRHHFQLPSRVRRQMSGCCWESAQSLTIDRNVNQTLAIFREVIDEKRCA